MFGLAINSFRLTCITASMLSVIYISIHQSGYIRFGSLSIKIPKYMVLSSLSHLC